MDELTKFLFIASIPPLGLGAYAVLFLQRKVQENLSLDARSSACCCWWLPMLHLLCGCWSKPFSFSWSRAPITCTAESTGVRFARASRVASARFWSVVTKSGFNFRFRQPFAQ